MIAAAILCLWGCAKSSSGSLNSQNEKVFEAWIKTNYPDAVRTPLGAYIIEDTPGTGALIGDATASPYIRLEYLSRGLDGTVIGYTSDEMAKQLDDYNESDYFGPEVVYRGENHMYAGLDESVSEMRVGGHRTVVIPGWLMSYVRYGGESEYKANVTGTDTIYDFTVLESISDINSWEVDSIARYLAANFPSKAKSDTTMYGFYYIRTKAPDSNVAYAADSTFYINYIGRRLDGQVFDTSIRDTAEYYGVNHGGTYAPVVINCGETYTDYTMTSSKSSMIEGMSYCLSKMYPHEAGTCIFISKLGYAGNGSGDAIPAFSPLRFDIEIVDKP